MFYVADVDGPAICGLPIPCELCFVELHCAISTSSDKISFPVIDWEIKWEMAFLPRS